MSGSAPEKLKSGSRLYLFSNSCLVQFARTPIRGTVKTRLQSELGVEGCLALRRQLVTQGFHTLWNAALAPVELSVVIARLSIQFICERPWQH